VVKYKNQLKVH